MVRSVWGWRFLAVLELAVVRTVVNDCSSSRILQRARRSSMDSCDGTPGRVPEPMAFLAHLLRQHDGVDAAFEGDIVGGFASVGQSGRAGAELGRVDARQDRQLSCEDRC